MCKPVGALIRLDDGSQVILYEDGYATLTGSGVKFGTDDYDWLHNHRWNEKEWKIEETAEKIVS